LHELINETAGESAGCFHLGFGGFRFGAAGDARRLVLFVSVFVIRAF
jgi:hypothetical protein